MKKALIITLSFLASCSLTWAKDVEIKSPDGRIVVTLSGDYYSISHNGENIISNATAGLTLEDGTEIKLSDKIKKTKKTEGIKEHIEAPFYRQSSFDFEYNKLLIEYRNGFSIEWKVSNEGVAYRFINSLKGKTVIKDEKAEFNFAGDYQAWLPYSTNPRKPQAMAFQNRYTVQKISAGTPASPRPMYNPNSNAPLPVYPDLLAFLPATVDCGDVKVTILESDLKAYPGMFVKPVKGSRKLVGVFSKYPKTFDNYAGRVQRYVTETEDFIAQNEGPRSYPWRILAITTEDKQMPVNNMVYALAEPNKIGDTSWIKPGFSSWEWWNDWQLTGVDFKAGINMETYKYYIDFASNNGLEYLILDEGWYVPSSGDMLTPIKELDIPELVEYAKERNVKLILWCVFNVLDDRCEEICKHYAEMGIAGFKIDFLDRDDQEALEMTYRIAETCAKYQLIVDFHGISKPTGINRTYPNVLNYEAIFGQEEVRWSEVNVDMPLYNVTAPFIRMMAGYTDYTPGAMRNATKADFQPIYNNSMTMGTRAHQVALYVVYDSPLTMLCDSPTMYEAEKETLDYISSLPRIYDKQLVLSGKMGEYIVVARKAGENWYIGGMTSWTERELEISYDFLGEGNWNVELFRDGVNANRNAEDYEIDSYQVKASDKDMVKLASGGGFVMKITKR